MSDNSLAQARQMGALTSSPIVRKDSLGKRDRTDFYQFSLNSSSSVNLNLSGMRSNADLSIFNGFGRQIMRSSRGGNRPETIQTNLEAGNYYVQVRGKGNKSTNYKLSASAIALNPTPPGGNPPGGNPPGGNPLPPPPPEGTFNNPINLGTLTAGTVTRSQDIASYSDSKYYKFQLANISDVNFTLSRVSDSTSMKLYYDFNNNGLADSGERIEYGSGSPSSSSPISEALPSTGNYFLEVNASSFGKSSIYDLVVATTPTPGNIPTDPGNDAPTAYNLGTLNRGSRIEMRDYIGRMDGADYYRFDMGANSNVSFNFQDIDTPEKDGYTIRLYRDINGNGLIDKDSERVDSYITQGEQIALQTGASYFLSLEPNQAAYNISYIMTMSAS
jgi:Bacterial pre-peptidase C-terminal domain